MFVKSASLWSLRSLTRIIQHIPQAILGTIVYNHPPRLYYGNHPSRGPRMMPRGGPPRMTRLFYSKNESLTGASGKLR